MRVYCYCLIERDVVSLQVELLDLLQIFLCTRNDHTTKSIFIGVLFMDGPSQDLCTDIGELTVSNSV